MRRFAEIHAIAADRKGGPAALDALLQKPLPAAELQKIPDDRWLSAMARCIFEAGFNWKVIEAKWPGFEEAFDGFDVARVGFYHDDDLDRLLRDTRIVRNGAKIESVIANARFLTDVAAEHGSAGSFFGAWPSSDFVGLLDLLKRKGSRLGGLTGQRFLRRMGVSSFNLSTDVVARLVAEGVVPGPPSSKSDMAAVQAAFNSWAAESGRSLTEISRVLAMSVGP
ncbi:MAG: DNA-3-methyladenine glycosylase I [Hyphomicrobiaceae bacterium]|nr:DNA-3-methyladenine glycosylase I [Hyphomicrobiaceae bacterium]